MQKTRVAFHTLGCKLNFSETSTISRQFGLESFEIVDFDEKADIYIVNSCSVTSVAEKKCRLSVRQAYKRNPDAKIAVIGCAVQANSDSFSKLEGVHWILGNKEKYQLGNLIKSENGEYEGKQFENEDLTLKVSDMKSNTEFVPSYSMNDRTRSFFKVQDGCDYFCAYCSIPYMRGRSRNNSVEETMKVAREIALTPTKEIVLTGVNIGYFGHGTEESFLDLLYELNNLEGIERIRISSIEPELLSDEIIQLVAGSPKLLPHFHLPLQSGNDKILSMMKRKYKRELFSSKINLIKRLMPQACIAADVIVGFPGESDEDFEDTFNFINNLDISYLHVFSYSERAGTFATKLEGKVHERLKHRRSEQLQELSESKKVLFYNNQLNRECKVLWESDDINGWMHGWTENYVHVRSLFDPELINVIELCRIISIHREKDLICDVVSV